MLRTNTVFVIGAGASHEARMPLGAGSKNSLTAKIAALLTRNEQGMLPNGQMQQVVQQLAGPQINGRILQDIYDAADRIAGAMEVAPSIDNFLEAWGHDPYIPALGKMAILRAILEAERESAFSKHTARPQPDEMWYAALGSLLVERVKVGEVEGLFANVRFVDFNYDRCLEVFLRRLLNSYYGVEDYNAATALLDGKILHPYGYVGALRQTPFGQPDQIDLVANMDRISTFTESVMDATVHSAILEAMGNSANVVFLGFGFIDQNLELIKPHSPTGAKNVYFTSKGFSPMDLPLIKAAIGEIYPSIQLTFHEERETCTAFFKNYRLSLRR